MLLFSLKVQPFGSLS